MKVTEEKLIEWMKLAKIYDVQSLHKDFYSVNFNSTGSIYLQGDVMEEPELYYEKYLDAQGNIFFKSVRDNVNFTFVLNWRDL